MRSSATVLLTLALFFAASAAIAALWNRWLPRVPWRFVAIFWLLCAAYQGETLFTSKVDLRPAPPIAPWSALPLAPEMHTNTGIVFTQLGPWTEIAREQIKSGRLPLWNRHSAAGAPLFANQQTAIAHPFTLLGLPLSLGKAFTLTATLRLFTLLFFTFAFLRGFAIRDEAALFGAIAYTFCTFHIVWLLFPLGLATMMLPVALAGAQQLDTRAGYVVLVLGLALSVLGGHPESALWVWIATAAFIVVQRTRIVFGATAFVVAMLLTAFSWYPTLEVLKSTERYQRFKTANPANHGLSAEWLLPLVTPNILGNPHDRTYTPPRGTHPAVLNDYGEVASSYAGLITLGLALAAPFVAPRKSLAFALGLMLFALLTIAETPLWRDALHAIPLAGISLHQRLRVFWDLGACIAAALTLDAIAMRRQRAVAIALIAVACVFAAMYAIRRPPFLEAHPLAIAQLAVPLLAVVLFLVQPRLAALLVLADLVVATWRYNPPARPEEIYPVTGAIHFLQRAPKPVRMAAMGWSFIPETPGAYGIEDVKATDPVQHFAYMFMLRGYLDVVPGSYDLVLRNVERPFADYLNIGYLFVPSEHNERPAGFVERYRGKDGVVLENTEVLPRYFLVRHAVVEPDLGSSIYRSRSITNFRDEAVVESSPFPLPEKFAGGSVRVASYEPDRTRLEIESDGRNLLVTSDANWAGWRARWNGKELPIVRTNGAFMGVYLPAGRGTLELRYLPKELVRGGWAGVVGIVLFALQAMNYHRRSHV
ncbi:MAG TPA: YfhO family protein [Thermoanaerobaculia bacterium]|nr:YfhO family protein [Thermoanaerobaculia bacterium]